MNPETELTTKQLRVICEKHNIPYHSNKRINIGFSHEVHKLNDDLIIKLYNSRDPKRFKIESRLLAMDLPFPKPKSIVTDYDKNIGKNYVIMSYIPGASLGSVWHKTNDRQREVLIKDICNVLKNINEVDPSILDDKSNSWQESRMQKAERIIGILKVNGIFNETQVQKATEAIKHYAPALAGNERKPVYWDIHFDNFLVNDNYELQGVVDLENVIYAALDYPLFVIQRMTDEPEKMLREEDEQYARTEDYARVKGWYEQYYPEMFDFPNLAVRLKFYQLLDALHLLRDWSHNKELWDKFEDLVNT